MRRGRGSPAHFGLMLGHHLTKRGRAGRSKTEKVGRKPVEGRGVLVGERELLGGRGGVLVGREGMLVGRQRVLGGREGTLVGREIGLSDEQGWLSDDASAWRSTDKGSARVGKRCCSTDKRRRRATRVVCWTDKGGAAEWRGRRSSHKGSPASGGRCCSTDKVGREWARAGGTGSRGGSRNGELRPFEPAEPALGTKALDTVRDARGQASHGRQRDAPARSRQTLCGCGSVTAVAREQRL